MIHFTPTPIITVKVLYIFTHILEVSYKYTVDHFVSKSLTIIILHLKRQKFFYYETKWLSLCTLYLFWCALFCLFWDFFLFNYVSIHKTIEFFLHSKYLGGFHILVNIFSRKSVTFNTKKKISNVVYYYIGYKVTYIYLLVL